MNETTEEQELPKEFHAVKLIWRRDVRSTPEKFDNVVSFTFEHDIWFFFIWNPENPELPGRKTVWQKHPDLLGIEMEPYEVDWS